MKDIHMAAVLHWV